MFKDTNLGAYFLYDHFFVTSIFELLYFLKFLKKLALFDSYYLPFYKPHAKINDVLLISEHTVILPDRTLKKWGLSNLTF